MNLKKKISKSWNKKKDTTKALAIIILAFGVGFCGGINIQGYNITKNRLEKSGVMGKNYGTMQSCEKMTREYLQNKDQAFFPINIGKEISIKQYSGRCNQMNSVGII